MSERVIQFGPAQGLVGILTEPDEPPAQALPAVVLLSAGLMHRVGPNRLYIQMARALAREGHTVLRFDFSGLGDSRPRADHLPYHQSAPAEARDAIDWLAQHGGVQHVVLIGHCAGAVFSLLVARDDPRVVGAVMINPEGGDVQWTEIDRIKKESQNKARTYAQQLTSRERWMKLLRGQANYRSLFRMVFKDILWYRIVEKSFRIRQFLQARSKAVRTEQTRQAEQYLLPIVRRGAPLLLLHSEGSTGLSHIRATFGAELERLLADGNMQLTIIPQSDHLFTLVDRQRQVCATLTEWMREHISTRSGQPTAVR
jgi:pimeloyl-ACP methyl ester carboxylesterase